MTSTFWHFVAASSEDGSVLHHNMISYSDLIISNKQKPSKAALLLCGFFVCLFFRFVLFCFFRFQFVFNFMFDDMKYNCH